MKTLMHKSVVAQFESIAHSFPARKAVVDACTAWTYDKLNDCADVLADSLRAKGFATGQVAVLLFNRTPLAIAAMIAVLKTGGCYLPLEPTAPYLRNKKIVDESGASLILTTEDVMATTGDGSLYQTLLPVFDVETLHVSGRAYQPVVADVGSDAAYVIYTSGSTGMPKGAINCQNSLINLVWGLTEEIVQPYETGDPLNIALLAPFVFDPSVQQIYLALLGGHTLHMAPERARLDGGELLCFLNRCRIDIADGTPTHLKLMTLAPKSAGDLLRVKHFIVGGEALAVDVVNPFWDRFSDPQPALTNIYGVAECCVDVTHYLVDRAAVMSLGCVPIGRPFANMKVAILDEDLKPVEGEDPGELCIGAPSIGNGYLGRPDLTAEKFITDPSDGTCIYRTGDRAKKLPDGSILYMGRFDRQMKLRGYRIEPGEIESAIKTYGFHPSARSAISDNKRSFQTCRKCLLTDRHPGVSFENGICSVCKKFESYKWHVNRYFQTEKDFQGLMAQAQKNKQGKADVLLLYSGGKDSTYVLFRLIEMGYHVDTFTFDNGFISKTAFRNIHRITRRFGIHHVNATIDNMKKVFAESLSNSSTVCNGCFRALTMLSTKIAHERGINVIVTGLSRGQIFDTKLKQLYEHGICDPDEIDQRLMVHRKIFYSQEDTVSKTLQIPQEESIYDIHYVDFFRYANISAPAIRQYLSETDQSWIAPKDTGLCSTNCLINNVGIYVHNMEKGYHNYAEPLSWDLRLGVISREAAQKELVEEIDVKQVEGILKYLNYTPGAERVIDDVVVGVQKDGRNDDYLIAWFVSSRAIEITHLREYLAQRLADYMVPRHLVRVDKIPITHNGKVDYDQLPVPESVSTPVPLGAGSDRIRVLKGLWGEVLDRAEIGVDDNFFDLGGHSLTATILVGLIEQQFQKEISVIDMVKNPTIKKMADFLELTS